MNARKKILLVDDESDFRFSASVALRKAGYDVTEAADGREALGKVLEAQGTREPYSLVVTDIRMPVMSGLELVDEMRRFEIPAPVVVITGVGDRRLAADLAARGGLDYLEKPFKPEELVARIGDVFRRGKRSAPGGERYA